jgi:multicomponent Na+:H+ antiporter subunit C
MSSAPLYAAAGVALFLIGLHALVWQRHLVRKIIAVNVMGSGASLLLVALGHAGPGATDPVPQAMVITGIVVAVSATGLALSLTLRLARASGQVELPRPRGDDR